MKWEEYQKTLMPLIQHFGKSFYSIDRVRLGFQSWRDESPETLLYRVNEAISSNMPFDLSLKQFVKSESSVNESKLPYRKYYQHEEPKNISDGFLEKILNENNAESLLDLVRKYKSLNIKHD